MKLKASAFQCRVVILTIINPFITKPEVRPEVSRKKSKKVEKKRFFVFFLIFNIAIVFLVKKYIKNDICQNFLFVFAKKIYKNKKKLIAIAIEN